MTPQPQLTLRLNDSISIKKAHSVRLLNQTIHNNSYTHFVQFIVRPALECITSRCSKHCRFIVSPLLRSKYLLLSLSPSSCRTLGEHVPLPHHGRPGAVHGHRAQLQHGRLLRRPLHQHHGLVRAASHAYVDPAEPICGFMSPFFCSSQPAERLLQKAAERRHLQVQVRQLGNIAEQQDAALPGSLVFAF